MGWLKVLKVVGELVLPWLMSKLNRDKARRAEKIAQVVIEGVEAYANTPDKKDVKAIIRKIAVATGVEDKLIKAVKKYTTPKVK